MFGPAVVENFLMDVEIYFIYKNTIIEGGGEFL
jgi:hypothetical protein